MYLEKLEIQGFKSFANKNVLIFPGMVDKTRRGLTSVVGPNGSGKSNVADSVRWALGEQSMKTLRGKKSEDIIFSGSDKKGKLGMAEVSLYLNNEDKKAPIDYSQVVLTRRLYRDGESEYLLNNNRVRLTDIQMLLAKANFGQKTYSVIGQGMVEGFLNTSLSERKEFFDEATGVKQYQIKRDDSLNKLRSSYENLYQAQMLVSEIEPRLKSLTRQVSRLKRRGEIEAELRSLQTVYYAKIWHEINDQFNIYNNDYLELEKNKQAKDKKLSALQHDLDEIMRTAGQESEYDQMQKRLADMQNIKDELNRKLAKIEAQMEVKLEANGQFDLSFLLGKKEELAKLIKSIEEDIAGLTEKLKNDQDKSRELETEKSQLDQTLKELNNNLIKVGQNVGKDEMVKINKNLLHINHQLKMIRQAETIEEVRTILAAVEAEIDTILEISAKLAVGAGSEVNGNKELGDMQATLAKLNISKDEIQTKIHENNIRISAHTERAKLLQESLVNLKKEFTAIAEKLQQKSETMDLGDMEAEKKQSQARLQESESQMNELRIKINQRSQDEEKKMNHLFNLQQSLQDAQREITDLTSRLNEIKINSTRYETKLEDLEIEIREELGSLKDIKQNKNTDEVNMDEIKEKISQQKRQLEQIGGIDPQTEKEYDETKERYDFLSGQIDDLSRAVESLQKVIKELDITIKDRFDKEFNLIEKKFEEYFKILFNGGQAKIIKVMEEELKDEEAVECEGTNGETVSEKDKQMKEAAAEIKKIKYLQKFNATGLAGIEIQATPPGKKIKSITMLSGGERALTAIALICAIISSNPAPFVVLDEVDAALDEANSERLAKILDELSHKTQFIVITHNRASMRRSNILYGVTMGDDGVSKLLSVKLDDVKVE